ncbi:MAG: nickel-dependent hydrogenase large subunit [Bacillota bacterium]|nr:nickel-dependent hydrogenase large subunit [Bacillota bacterium]
MPGQSVIPFGPQHPVFPEPLQLRLVMKEERVLEAVPALGYMHRGLEKLAETKDYAQNVFLMERVCGICSFMHSLCYCQALEDLMGIEVPPRARYLRTIWAELGRLQSHHLWLGLLADAFGFESLFMECWKNREIVMDLCEATTGNRVIISGNAVGGCRRDLEPSVLKEIGRRMDDLERGLDRVAPVFQDDPLIKQRTVGTGIITREEVIRLGAVGPVLRASGVAQDMRQLGYAAYGELDFRPVVETGGDSYSRLMARLGETYQAIDLVRQALRRIPEGEVLPKVKGRPEGEAVSRVEQPRGELLYYVRATGKPQLDRVRVRTPTLSNIPPLVRMLEGCRLSDVPVIALSIDSCVSCTER